MRFSLGQGTRNVLLNRENGEAAYRQDPAEHEALIHKYETPGMTPYARLLAAIKGLEEEKQNPRYWNDEVPRLDLGGSSSWIDQIEYVPSLGMAIMKTNGREYYYPMTSTEVGDWMNSDSLGSYYNKFIKLKR